MGYQQIYLRVNGIEITNLKIRRKMISGFPVGEHELVIEDPTLGNFAIDDNDEVLPGSSKFLLEVKIKPSNKWKTISVNTLIQELLNI